MIVAKIYMVANLHAVHVIVSQSTSLSITITSSSSTPQSGVGLRSRRDGFLLERGDIRDTLAPLTPTKLAPSDRVPTPFDWRVPKLCPGPVPHFASSTFLVSVSSVALFFPLLALLEEESVDFPLRELPAPTKVVGG